MIPDSGTTFVLRPQVKGRKHHDTMSRVLKRFDDGHTNVAKEFVQNWFLSNCGAWLVAPAGRNIAITLHSRACSVRDGRERIPSLSSALTIFVVLIRSCSVVHLVQIVFLQYTVGHDMTTEPSHVNSVPERCQCGSEMLTFAEDEVWRTSWAPEKKENLEMSLERRQMPC